MLINLTNHPWEYWEEKQKQLALHQFGSVMDMEFPAIDPEASEAMIVKIAEEYLQKIQALRNSYASVVVHIMGEMTFCFTLINMLKKHDIPCVASTTRRIVRMDNQTKVAEFRFVRFRYYP
jgi:predicted methyltransferase